MTRQHFNTFCLLIITPLLCLVTLAYSALEKSLMISGEVNILKPQDPVLKMTTSSDTSAFRSSTVFTLDLGNKFYTSNITNMENMFLGTGGDNNTFELNLKTFDFSNVTSTNNIFRDWSSTQKIYVKNTSDQNWVIAHKGNGELSTSNVLIRT